MQLAPDDLSHSLFLTQWICFPARPLNMRELRHAMVINPTKPFRIVADYVGSENYVATDSKMKKRITSLSGGLVEIKQGATAQFVHQSVQEFLIREGLQLLDCATSNSVASRAQWRLSRACLHYLSMRDVTQGNLYKFYFCSDQENAYLGEKFPLLQYVSEHWTWHTRKAEQERLDKVNYWKSPKHPHV